LKNGIIPVNKPMGFTSFDVVAKCRGILKTKKIGHAGTLDPMAMGVLPIFIGTATKACDMLPDNDKAYIAEFKLGIKTDTEDITGKVIKQDENVSVKKDDILSVIPFFTGEIMQIPPMYSAVSVGGKRLYELARKGIEVERTPRKITIYKLSLESFDEEEKTGKLYIECSKGTYIRTLISDIAEKAGSCGTMTSLVRVKASGFSLSECITLDELFAMEDPYEKTVSIEKVFSYLPRIEIKGAQERMYRNGIRLSLKKMQFKKGESEYAVFGENEFLGIAIADYENDELIIKKNFYER